MEVLVITRHLAANYGSLLQAIATQKVLTGMGVTSRVIDYIPKDETGIRVAFTQLKEKESWNHHPLKKALYVALREPENLIMHSRFGKMRNRYLIMTERFDTPSQLVSFAEGTNAIFMTGSDQVWGLTASGAYDPSYFLDFVPKGKMKVAFAASFGKTQFKDEDLKEYRRYLSSYDVISVRENSAVELISKLGLSAQQVLDPTLLLTEEEWFSFLNVKNEAKEKYVLVYQIHSNPEMDKFALAFARKVNLPLIRVSPMLHQVKRGGRFVYLPDIGKFLTLIKNAAYMVTDSFHGTAFAINFNIQFAEILSNTGTGSRNQSILELTGLQDRIVKDFEDFSLVNRRIDFLSVNDVIKKERNRSKKFLADMIALSV